MPAVQVSSPLAVQKDNSSAQHFSFRPQKNQQSLIYDVLFIPTLIMGSLQIQFGSNYGLNDQFEKCWCLCRLCAVCKINKKEANNKTCKRQFWV